MNQADMLRHINQIAGILDAMRSMLTEAQPDVPPTIASEEAKGICHFCKESIEPGETVIRGIHERCYKIVRRSLQVGQVTEEFLVRQGRLAPRKPSGRKSGSDIIEQLLAKADVKPRKKP